MVKAASVPIIGPRLNRRADENRKGNLAERSPLPKVLCTESAFNRFVIAILGLIGIVIVNLAW